MKSINVKLLIDHWATVPKGKFFYAEIDGRLYAGKHNKILFRRISDLKSSLRQSVLWYRIVQPLANNYISFLQPQPPVDQRLEIKERMWQEFIGPNGRVQIKSIEL